MLCWDEVESKRRSCGAGLGLGRVVLLWRGGGPGE